MLKAYFGYFQNTGAKISGIYITLMIMSVLLGNIICFFEAITVFTVVSVMFYGEKNVEKFIDVLLYGALNGVVYGGISSILSFILNLNTGTVILFSIVKGLLLLCVMFALLKKIGIRHREKIALCFVLFIFISVYSA